MAIAAEGNYEAMVLRCVEPRLQEPVSKSPAWPGLTGKYSQFAFAGAAIGVVAEPFKNWHKAFWDNLAASVALRPCREGDRDRPPRLRRREDRLRRGESRNREIETEGIAQHSRNSAAWSARRQPKLAVETALMAIDGTIEEVIG